MGILLQYSYVGIGILRLCCAGKFGHNQNAPFSAVQVRQGEPGKVFDSLLHASLVNIKAGIVVGITPRCPGADLGIQDGGLAAIISKVVASGIAFGRNDGCRAEQLLCHGF